MAVIRRYFDQGPKVKVSFTLGKEMIQTISLQSSNQFHSEIYCENENQKTIQDILNWLVIYTTKERNAPSLPIDLSSYTPFQTKVYRTLTESNASDVFSYKELAEKIGRPKAYRAVGSCCGKNRFLLYIPCHRVIRSDQTLGGFALPLQVKQELLAFEAK